jgi:integrase
MSISTVRRRRRETSKQPTVRQENPPGRSPRWRVELRPNGRRQRNFFSTEQQALEFVAKEQARTHELGQRAAGISGALLEDAIRADEILRRFPGVTLLDAAESYAKAHDNKQRSKTARAVADELIAANKANGLTLVHRTDVEDRLGKFCDTFGETLMADITTKEAEKWLANLGRTYKAQSVVNFHRIAKRLFAYAVPRGYCEKNIFTTIDKPKVKAKETVGIFTPDELQAILLEAHPDLLPWLAIGAFAGLRTAELDRLHWEDINFERGYVEVKSSKSKTAKRRLVPITDALAAWLEPYKNKGRTGSIRPKNFHNKRRAAYRAAGFSTPCNEPKDSKEREQKLRKAPDNALRHSFASYRLADTNDAARTAMELGHTSTTLLFSTYRELVSPETAKDYWAIRPSGTTAAA